MIVGEGGINPDYFLYRMQWWEVQRFINGLRRRIRPQWESVRWLGWIVGKMMGEKKTESPEDFMTFNWEEEVVDEAEVNRKTLKLIDELREKNKAAQDAAHTSGS